MNLWDSIHRGLDKASQEAARMAKVQRLRTIIDGMARHMNTQQAQLLEKTMELYTNGQLTQSELLPICKAMAELQQQMQQAQNELKLLQGSAPVPPPPPQLQGPGTAPQPGATVFYPGSGETIVTGPYMSPSDYQPYVDASAFTAPPPPSGPESFAGGAMETGIAPPPPPQDIAPVMASGQPPSLSGTDSPRYCPVCQAELNPSYAFCHNCGTLIQNNLAQMQTMRAGTVPVGTAQGQVETSEQETIRAGENAPAEENEGV